MSKDGAWLITFPFAGIYREACSSCHVILDELISEFVKAYTAVPFGVYSVIA